MRVIAGSLKGLQFASPHGHRTHPMSDKMRGALFNALGDLDDLTVLDAFAGSGALMFEALSRGAAQVTAIDEDRQAQRAIDRNIAKLGLTKAAKLIRASVEAWLRTSADSFDIILADPPYDRPQLSLLNKLATRVSPGGILVLSLPPDMAPELPGFELIQAKVYGDGSLRFYRAP